jgi:hypothetical protein
VGFPLTQQHIADTLGMSLVHTNKTLQRLRRSLRCAGTATNWRYSMPRSWAGSLNMMRPREPGGLLFSA